MNYALLLATLAAILLIFVAIRNPVSSKAIAYKSGLFKENNADKSSNNGESKIFEIITGKMAEQKKVTGKSHHPEKRSIMVVKQFERGLKRGEEELLGAGFAAIGRLHQFIFHKIFG